MPQGKKQHRDPSWLKRLGSYRVFSAPVGSWLFIGVLFALLAGAFYLFILREYDAPTSQTFVAEVGDVWIQSYESETGGGITYLAELQVDNKELRCRVSPIQVQLWYGLEIGRKYEFSITLTQSRCFINEVAEIDETGFSQ